MKKRSNKGWLIALIVWLLVLACTLPAAAPPASEPTLSQQDIAATTVSIALTSQAAGNVVEPSQPPPAEATATSPAAPTDVPTATQCVATVTATTNANVRTGPGLPYDVIGVLPTGGTARVAGQNDAHTWWYIEFAGGPGGYAWIAASVTSATCIPSALQIVVAPPLPTAVPATFTPTLVAMPDLYVSEYAWSPVPPHMGVSFHVRIGVYNQGNAIAGAFTVQWWLSTTAPSPHCTWNLPSLVAHGGRILECDYTPLGWNNAYPSRVVADSSNTVVESDESNNTWSQSLQIAP